MQHTASRGLFAIAAFFNAVLAIAFVFWPDYSHQLLVGRALSGSPAMTQMFGLLVFVFGVGYAAAAVDLVANRAVIQLAILGKLLILVLAVWLVFINGQGALPMFAIAAGDGIFALLFAAALRAQARLKINEGNVSDG